MAIDFYHASMNAYDAQHFEEAFEYLQEGIKADVNDERCHFSLGVMYYNAQGVARSFKQSTYHYEIAATAGVLPAQVSVGFAYANAMGVAQDFEKAIHFLTMAIAQDDVSAKITLAEIYARDEGYGSRKEASKLIKEVLALGSVEEAMDVYHKYQLDKV